jgi:hypothetical protein
MDMPLDPKFAGSNPVEDEGFKGDKQMPILVIAR